MSTIYESLPLTDGNLRNSHIYISPFRDQLPRDVIGGSTKDSPAPRLIRLEHGGEMVDTFIPTTKKGDVRSFFHARSFVGSFFERSGAEIGDIVLFEEISPYHLRMSLAPKSSPAKIASRRIATAEEYSSFFETDLGEKERQALEHHAVRGEISIDYLAELVGYSSYESINRLYGWLGRRISDQLGLSPIENNGKSLWISVISEWNSQQNTVDQIFRSFLHEEVIQGMHLAGLLSDEDVNHALILQYRAKSRLPEATSVESAVGHDDVSQDGLVTKSKLAPKHEGDFSGTYPEHEAWHVYVLALRNERGQNQAFKIGYSHSPADRCRAHNKPLVTEVTGLEWVVLIDQKMQSEDEARDVEQRLLAEFSMHRLPSNGEIVIGIQETSINSSLACILKGD